MKIGIIGMGVVGNANYTGFNLLGHDMIMHDKKFDTTIEEVLPTEIAFICVPTPVDENGRCDTREVENVIKELSENNYNGIVAIRSTIVPGFTDSMSEKYSNLIICFVPEFLRERCAADDFINNHQLLAVGTHDIYAFKKIVAAHGDLPKNTKQLTPAEAEILKYFNNAYAALRITFANIMYELCDKFESDYTTVKDTYILTGKATDLYLDVNNRLRGYGGTCLPKDIAVLKTLLDETGLDYSLIDSIDKDNKTFKKTVFNGMRKDG